MKFIKLEEAHNIDFFLDESGEHDILFLRVDLDAEPIVSKGGKALLFGSSRGNKDSSDPDNVLLRHGFPTSKNIRE